MTGDVWQTLLSAHLISSVCVTAVAALSILSFRLMPSRFPARWRYRALVALALLLLIPYRPVPSAAMRPATLSRAAMQAPSTGASQSSWQGEAHLPFTAPTLSTAPTRWIAAAWLFGAVACLAVHLLRHLRFARYIRRWRVPADESIRRALALQCARMGVDPPPLDVCTGLPSPVLYGLLRPRIALPPDQYADTDLSAILAHELTHLKRGDLFVRALMLVVCAAHWFNPAVAWMDREIMLAGEMAVDEAVLAGQSRSMRIAYAQVIVAATQPNPRAPSALSTGFQGGITAMKRRITAMLSPTIGRAGLPLIALALAIALLTPVAFATATLPEPPTPPLFWPTEPDDSDASLTQLIELYFASPGAEDAILQSQADTDSFGLLKGDVERQLLMQDGDDGHHLILMMAADELCPPISRLLLKAEDTAESRFIAALTLDLFQAIRLQIATGERDDLETADYLTACLKYWVTHSDSDDCNLWLRINAMESKGSDYDPSIDEMLYETEAIALFARRALLDGAECQPLLYLHNKKTGYQQCLMTDANCRRFELDSAEADHVMLRLIGTDVDTRYRVAIQGNPIVELQEQ